MKIGISAFAWTSKLESRHLELLPSLKELGLSAVEIPMFDPSNLPIAEIRRSFEQNDLDCTVCAILPSDINPISDDRETRKKSLEHLKRCIDAAYAMNAQLLGGPLLAPIGYLPARRPTDDEWSWAVEAFQALRDVLNATGMRISIEPVNRSETFFIRTAKEAASFCAAVGDPHIGVTIDTFHANIEERSIADAIRSLGSHLSHIHASENDRGPLGLGHVPFVEIIAALREVNYRGYLMIEGFGYSPDERDSPGFQWANQDVSPEMLVAESFKYLSALTSR